MRACGPRRRGCRGIAVPLALFGIVILGLVVAASLWGSMVERTAGRQALQAIKARQAADASWMQALGMADSLASAVPASGDSLSLALMPLPGRASSQTTVHRLGPRLLLLHGVGAAHAVDGAVVARHDVQVLLAIDSVPDSSGTGIRAVLTPVVAPYWAAHPRAD